RSEIVRPALETEAFPGAGARGPRPRRYRTGDLLGREEDSARGGRHAHGLCSLGIDDRKRRRSGGRGEWSRSSGAFGCTLRCPGRVDGHHDAGNGWVRGDPALESSAVVREAAGDCPDGASHEGRTGAVPGSGRQRLPDQTGRTRPVARGAASMAEQGEPCCHSFMTLRRSKPACCSKPSTRATVTIFEDTRPTSWNGESRQLWPSRA